MLKLVWWTWLQTKLVSTKFRLCLAKFSWKAFPTRIIFQRYHSRKVVHVKSRGLNCTIPMSQKWPKLELWTPPHLAQKKLSSSGIPRRSSPGMTWTGNRINTVWTVWWSLLKPVKGLQPQPKAQILKTKEELLLEELRKQRAKDEGEDEGEVEEKTITIDDCIPEENIGKNVQTRAPKMTSFCTTSCSSGKCLCANFRSWYKDTCYVTHE